MTGYNKLYTISPLSPGTEYVSINTDKEELTLKENNKETIFSLKEINAELIKKYHNSENSALNAQDLTFVLESQNRKIKIILQNYALKNPKFNGENTNTVTFQEYPNISGYALVK
ncbi:MAG: hypothetical protein WCK88_02350 [bacterium]